MEKIIDNKISRVIFINKKEVSKDVFEVIFKTEQKFSFNAGQYVWLQIPELAEIEGGDRRAFSILNNFDGSNTVSLLFRRGKSLFKKKILEAEEGQEFNIIGPFGHSFLLPENSNPNLVLIGGGVGISPFISLSRDIKAKNLKIKTSVLSFEKNEENLYKEELSKNEAIDFNYYNEEPSEKLLKKFIGKNTLYYISGSQNFVNKINEILSSLGVDRPLMKFENFYPQDATTNKINALLEKELSDKTASILLSAIKVSSHHIIITDINGFVLFANEAAQKITGYSLSEMKGNTPRLWGGLMDSDFYRKLWASKKEGKNINEQIINRRKNGDIYYVISHINPIKDDSGMIVGFVATEEDITPMQEKEFEILKSHDEMERFTLLMADREIKMIEMKKELEELKSKQNDTKN